MDRSKINVIFFLSEKRFCNRIYQERHKSLQVTDSIENIFMRRLTLNCFCTFKAGEVICTHTLLFCTYNFTCPYKPICLSLHINVCKVEVCVHIISLKQVSFFKDGTFNKNCICTKICVCTYGSVQTSLVAARLKQGK